MSAEPKPCKSPSEDRQTQGTATLTPYLYALGIRSEELTQGCYRVPVTASGDVAMINLHTSFFKDLLVPLANRVCELVNTTLAMGSQRIVICVSGGAGAGKTTICQLLMAVLLHVHCIGSALISMDSYHHYNSYLDQHGMRHLKGSPQTIDSRAMLKDMIKVVHEKTDSAILLPEYDRLVHDPVPGRCLVEPPNKHKVIFVEGLHLLRPEEEWTQMRELYTECWFLRFNRVWVQKRRVVARKVRGGKTEEEAEKYFDRVDAPIIHEVDGQAREFHHSGRQTSLILTFDSCASATDVTLDNSNATSESAAIEGHIRLTDCSVAFRGGQALSHNFLPRTATNRSGAERETGAVL